MNSTYKGVLVLLSLGALLAACGSESPAGPPQFAELVPVEMMQAALPPPAPPPPVEAKPVAPTGPVYGGHLASYFREADARRGWNIIVRQQSSIGSLKEHIVPIKTAKGPMVRLIAGDFPTKDEAERFCTWAHGQHLYCAVMVLGPNDASSTPVSASKPAPKR
jgi:cell division septation protein DedD